MKVVCKCLLLIFSLSVALDGFCQRDVKPTHISGLLVDSITNEPLPFAAVFLKGSDRGTMTDENGRFEINTSVNFINVSVSLMGYNNKEVFVTKGESNNITIQLVPTGVALNELVVKPKKEKYSKKNNPAVAFAKRVMAKKKQYDPKNHPYYSFEKYYKLTCGLTGFSNDKESWILKKFKFLHEFMDTSEVSGKRILPMSIKERVSTESYRLNPESHKEYIKGVKRAGIDEVFDEESIQRFLEDVFREINIFSNDVTFMQNRFVSPLSNIGTDFYKYYLNDTVTINGVKCIDLSFSPFNPQSFGFNGRIYVVADDTTMFVKKVKMNVPKDINLNYVEKIYIEQDFEKAPDGSRLKTRDDMTVEFRIIPATQELYARRVAIYSDHSFDKPQDESIFKKEATKITAADANYMPEEFWKDNRKTPIKESENSVKHILARLRQVPLFYWGEKVVVTLVSGYIPTSKDSKFDFGPMNTTISGNTLEGLRLKTGGMTTANLNDHLFARGYVAYGFGDKKWKYSGQLEYSFNKKKYHNLEFPIHSLRLLHKYDLDHLGQHYLYTNDDNVFLALKRMPDKAVTYKRTSELEYKLETESGFSIAAGMKFDIQEASKFIPFVDGYGKTYDNYKETSFNITLRYAPGETFYQTKTYRIPINLDAPVFTLSHTYAPKGFLGSKYCINKTEVGVQKRFWLSAFGYTDIILKGGKIWSNVAFPDLMLPNANLSYTIQPESFVLMSPMEFMNDRYLSWDITYWANGAIFNRLPLIKYLKLREAFSFRGLYGKLKDSNNPANNLELLRFPDMNNSSPMDKTPYMEMGVGIDNILTCLRVDYVWRLTYMNRANIDRRGLRIQLHFTF